MKQDPWSDDSSPPEEDTCNVVDLDSDSGVEGDASVHLSLARELHSVRDPVVSDDTSRLAETRYFKRLSRRWLGLFVRGEVTVPPPEETMASIDTRGEEVAEEVFEEIISSRRQSELAVVLGMVGNPSHADTSSEIEGYQEPDFATWAQADSAHSLY